MEVVERVPLIEFGRQVQRLRNFGNPGEAPAVEHKRRKAGATVTLDPAEQYEMVAAGVDVKPAALEQRCWRRSQERRPAEPGGQHEARELVGRGGAEAVRKWALVTGKYMDGEVARRLEDGSARRARGEAPQHQRRP